MKSKNLLLGMIALLFAVGGAVASSNMLQDVYVWGTSTTNDDPHCIKLTQACDSQPGVTCRIAVPVNGVSTNVNQTFSNSGCSILLTNSTETRFSVTPVTESITSIIAHP